MKKGAFLLAALALLDIIKPSKEVRKTIQKKAQQRKVKNRAVKRSRNINHKKAA